MSHDRDAKMAPSTQEAHDDLEWLRSQVQWQSCEITSLQLRQQDLERRAAELQIDLLATRKSTSWRVTAPLRAVTLAVRWALSGRPRHILAECMRLMQREQRHRGTLGMLKRLPRYLRRAGNVVAAIDQNAGSIPDRPAIAAIAPRPHPDLIDGIADAASIEATVSVIIPTLNAGPEFEYMLRKLRTQLGVRHIEIVIVDSGSTDATVSLARAAGAVVVEIPPVEFSHSGARNLGADTATGDHLLFMVQDAYPIGDHWVYGLLDYLRDHAPRGVVALSCAEYCRDDSDMMYECSIANHYTFLGCKEFDRIGVFRGADQESLRSMGQLSDVSCLIPRDRFQQYRYRGNFAEDLDLGVRLIRDGHRIAMLASVKVIHSHNRTSYYYLKRTFVDITFLVNVFPDFPLPHCDSSAGLIAGAIHVSRQLGGWVDQVLEQGCNGSVHESAMNWLTQLRSVPLDGASLAQTSQLGDPRVEAFLLELADASRNLPVDGNTTDQKAGFGRSAQYFIDDFIMRFDHFNRYASPIYQGEDHRLLREWTSAVGKTYAASLGFTLAVLYLDRRNRPQSDAESQWLDRVATHLTTGV